jgi:hypothetical protein
LAAGSGEDAQRLEFELRPAGSAEYELSEAASGGTTSGGEEFVMASVLYTDKIPGPYELWGSYPGANAQCGWLRSQTGGCVLSQTEVTGVPTPSGAVNFDDKAALVAIELAGTELQQGGLFNLSLQWQGLSNMNEDYTVFVQILDSEDRIVGQVDSWPMQGTYPTSQWQTGETIDDPYSIQLAPDLAPGPYRLTIGLYLLETLERLPVLDEDGNAVDDKVIKAGLLVP